MKAAVLHEIGGIPRYEDFPDPVAGDDEVVIDVKAVAVENVDKHIAAGTHYASRQYIAQLPAIPAFDAVINTAVPDEALAQAYLDAKGDGYDVVLDYLWGRPTEILLRSLVPQIFAFPKPTRLIQIGEAAGAGLVLAAESLRTSGVEICGAAKGLGPQTMHEVYNQVVTWAQSGELTFDVVKVPLSDIETAWQRTDFRGSRLVVVP